MKLWLVRHPKPQIEPGICYGATDVPPEPGGPLALAQDLAQRIPMPAAGVLVWHSPLSRCALVAHELALLRPDLAISAHEGLREMNFGAWERQTWDAIGPVALDVWLADLTHHRAGGGESVGQLLGRVGEVLFQAKAHRPTLAVFITHAGVVRTVQMLQAGVSAEGPVRSADFPRESLPFAGIWATQF